MEFYLLLHDWPFIHNNQSLNMKPIYRHNKESLFRPRRSVGLMSFQPATVSGIQKGYLRAQSAALPSPHTGLGPQTGATTQGCLCAGNSTANQFLFLTGQSTSPYFKASLYDSVKNTMTSLTISGALGETNSDLKDASLVWLPTRSAWYLKSGGAAKVYPLTISGTTLTVGSAIDISGSFATAANTLMTADVTTGLFFFDNVAGVLKKYTTSGLSAGSFGSALTNPAAGYSATAGDASEMGFNYSNGKIYFFAPSVAAGLVVTFQEYSVAGDSWSTKTWPSMLKPFIAKSSMILADPTDNTYVWLLGAQNTTSDVYDPTLVRWKSSDNTSEVYAQITGCGLALRTGQTPTTQTVACIAKCMRTGVVSVTNGDMVFASGAAGTTYYAFNCGTKWNRVTIFNYTGSGYLLGLSAPVGVQNSSGGAIAMPIMSPVTFIVTVDGGTERWIQASGLSLDQAFLNIKLQFATSLKVEVVGGGQQLNGSSPSGIVVANIIS